MSQRAAGVVRDRVWEEHAKENAHMTPRFRRSVTFVLAVAGAIGLAWSGYRLVAAGSRPPLKVRPFVLEREIVSYTADPRGTVIRRETVSRRADGTISTEVWPVPGGLDAEAVRTLILPDGVLYQMSDSRRIRTKTTMAASDSARYRSMLEPTPRARAVIDGRPLPAAKSKREQAAEKMRGCSQPSERKAGAEKLLGYPVQIWQHEAMGANDLLVRLSYYRAPGLGCFPLKTVFEERNPDGSYAVRWASQPTTITRREPDPAAVDTGDAFETVSAAGFTAATGWNIAARLNLAAFGTADPTATTARTAPKTDKPDFNGQWELDLARSVAGTGERLGFRRVTLTLAHDEPLLEVVQETARGQLRPRILRLSLTTDGATHGDQQAQGSASWEDRTLVIRYVLHPGTGQEVRSERRLTLSPDGTTMAGDAHALSARGATSAAEVWQRKWHPASFRNLRSGSAK
jgi:hypothetical protein